MDNNTRHSRKYVYYILKYLCPTHLPFSISFFFPQGNKIEPGTLKENCTSVHGVENTGREGSEVQEWVWDQIGVQYKLQESGIILFLDIFQGCS